MDKETLEKLLDGKPKEIRTKAILLFNGTATCAKTYQDEPSSANRRNWEDSEAALKKYVGEIDSADGPDEEDKPLRTIAAVLEYLRAGDWRVTQTSLYRHQQQGKIAPRRDGFYALRDVDKYARTWLKVKSTGKKKAERSEEMQARKLQNELDIQEEQKRALKRKNDVEEGRLIPREMMEIELATWAGIMAANLSHWIKFHAVEWVRLVGGDISKVGELIAYMTREKDKHISDYATLEFNVIFAPKDGSDAPEETEEEVAQC